jgi:hypothetical protein
LLEVKRHFNEVVFLTNNDKSLQMEAEEFLKKNGISLMSVENEGYDFGMWYKAFRSFDVGKYDRIGLINDSCILFKKLDEVFQTINNSNWDYCGILDSAQVAYHLQSYFIIINKPAIPYVRQYFGENGTIKEFDNAIFTYEVGMSQYLLKNNLKLGSVFSYKINSTPYNPSFASIKELIKAGFPMIKKKIVFGNFKNLEPGFLRDINYDFKPTYIKLIKRYNKEPILDFKLLRKDFDPISTVVKLYFLSLWSSMYRWLRTNYRTARKGISL